MDFRSPNMRKRMRRCNPQKQSHWEEVLRRWEQGSQSVREYCRAEGLREAAFYWWRRELARRGLLSDTAAKPWPDASCVPSTVRRASGSRVVPAARATPISRAAATSRGTPAPRMTRRSSPPRRRAVSFLPVEVVEDGGASAAGGVEIILAQGRTLRVLAGFNPQTLAAVLAVLEAQPC
jgi:hypothetical protein